MVVHGGVDVPLQDHLQGFGGPLQGFRQPLPLIVAEGIEPPLFGRNWLAALRPNWWANATIPETTLTATLNDAPSLQNILAIFYSNGLSIEISVQIRS